MGVACFNHSALTTLKSLDASDRFFIFNFQDRMTASGRAIECFRVRTTTDANPRNGCYGLARRLKFEGVPVSS